MQLLVWTGFGLSTLNAAYVFSRSRHYRLFEANVEQGPGTPSAQRVRVQSSPARSPPLRLISDILGAETAESRAHPDNTRDVWELAVWDPRPISLQLLGLFSPLHVLIYMFELPLDPLEPRPSVTVFKCLVLQVGLSVLLQFLQSRNDQRLKDSAIIQKEVFHEYDTKFVRPRLHPIVRDVSTQVDMDHLGDDQESVASGTPTTLIRRGFQTHPNPNYLKHIDPDSANQPSGTKTSRLFTPVTKSRHSDSFTSSSSHNVRSRQSMPAGSTPGFAPPSGPGGLTASTTTGNLNFGGNMGVYTHSNSPLKKTTSLNDINNAGGFFSPRNSRELAAMEQRDAVERMQRRASPIKEETTRPAAASHWSQTTENTPPPTVNPFGRTRANAHRYERFPSRW